MESNTPVTPPRNRRAGRIEALPPQQPLMIPKEYQQPAPAPQPAKPADVPMQPAPAAAPANPPADGGPYLARTAPQTQPQQQQQPAAYGSYPPRTASANPQQQQQQRQPATYGSYTPRTASVNPQPPQQQRQPATYGSYPPRTAPANPQPQRQPATYGSYPPRTASANPQPQQQRQPATYGSYTPRTAPANPQPRPRAVPERSASSARPTTSARPYAQGQPAPAPRPQAAASTRPVYRDDPQTRRAAAERRQAPPRDDQEKPEKKSRTGSRWTTPTILLLIALAGVALITLKIASMTTFLRNDQAARAQAWEDTKFNYHITERADGILTVTWQDTIEHYAAMYNLDPAFVTAIIRNESSFRANAESGVGARGLMQMMPDTARWVAGKLGEPYDFDKLYDPETSIRYGCWYLGYLSDIFQGDTVLVCAAYHAGQGEVWGWLGDPSISPDGISVPIGNIPISNTRTYAGRVTQAYGIYKTLLYSPAPAPETGLPGADDADRLPSAR